MPRFATNMSVLSTPYDSNHSHNSELSSICDLNSQRRLTFAASVIDRYLHCLTITIMKQIILFALTLIMFGCGGSPSGSTTSEKAKPAPKKEVSDKGIGEIKNVKLNNPLDPTMVKRGEAIYQMKCAACHKLTDQRVVGPGWSGVTKKRRPEWIMNMTTNVDVMLAEDPEAQKLLKECLVRMPNQNMSIGDARDVLEFMYENDAKAAGE
jgi:cytochrome c551/c552